MYTHTCIDIYIYILWQIVPWLFYYWDQKKKGGIYKPEAGLLVDLERQKPPGIGQTRGIALSNCIVRSVEKRQGLAKWSIYIYIYIYIENRPGKD